MLFVPWVPTFVYQAKYTGTPWAAPPNFSAVINALTGFTDNQGSTLQTGTNQGRLLAVIYFAMLALALFGIGRSGRIIELDLRTRPRARSLCFVVLGTLFAAIAGGILTASVFSSRYAAVVFLPFVLLVALGTTTLLNPKVRVVIVGLAVVAGLVSSAQNVTTQRTQGNAVAAAINAQAKPGDVIAFCPDQLGPSVYRQIRDPSQYAMLTFPRRTGPQIVNWVNYADTVHAADPEGVRHRRGAAGRDQPPRVAGLGADVPDLRGQVRDDRHRPAERRHQERWRRAQRRDQPPCPVLRADEPHRVRRRRLLSAPGSPAPSLRARGGSTNLRGS